MSFIIFSLVKRSWRGFLKFVEVYVELKQFMIVYNIYNLLNLDWNTLYFLSGLIHLIFFGINLIWGLVFSFLIFNYLLSLSWSGKREMNWNVILGVQRGHQNSLEMMPGFYMLMILGGIRHPLISASLGAAYIVSRFFYFKGYSTGDPQNRLSIGWVATCLPISTVSIFLFVYISVPLMRLWYDLRVSLLNNPHKIENIHSLQSKR